MRSISILGIVLAVVIGSSTAYADRKQVRYVGIHPVAKSEGGGICYIEGPHVHVFGADKVQYRDHAGANYFVGDPVAYGYDGPKFTYKGHHPIHVNVVVGDDNDDVEYCYLDGPHFHYFAPPEGPEFRIVGDAYFYVAEPPAAYVEARPAMISINAVYRPLVYTRPVVTIEAPIGWIGARVDLGGPAVVVERPGAAVIVPSGGIRVDAEVRIPMPSVHVDIGIGSGPVFIGGGGGEGRGHGKHKKHKRR
ncbi:MAG: hypothetical protein H6Q90_2091 [Deltaproteobacteria bacterium]|nr:hypothetical protein [Deltaproteobacteria bacterium]